MLEQWRQRLEAELADLTVQGAAELAAAQANQQRDTAYVILADETGSGNALENAVRQQVTVGVAVVLAITNRRDRRGEAGMNEIEIRRKQVLVALLGWQPDEDSGQVIFRRGRLMSLADKTLWWQDEFETTRLISAI